MGAEFVRDVEPGEIVTITPNGILSDKSHCLPAEKQGRCIFEYIYFARPDSRIDGINVYSARLLAGRFLAKDSPVDADIVVGRARNPATRQHRATPWNPASPTARHS